MARITADAEPAGSATTIEALERESECLDRVAAVFSNLASADSNDRIEALQREISPELTAWHSQVAMNPVLFARIGVLYG